jgi:hypothetical protein
MGNSLYDKSILDESLLNLFLKATLDACDLANMDPSKGNLPAILPVSSFPCDNTNPFRKFWLKKGNDSTSFTCTKEAGKNSVLYM